MELSKYRLISGIRTQRSNPMVLYKKAKPKSQKALEELVETADPWQSEKRFQAQEYDKDHTFNFLQHRWFEKKLDLDEEVTLSARQLKQFCDEAHEMGKMRQALLVSEEESMG